MRKNIFTNGEYYHIFNRGTDKREIFSDIQDYERFLLSMNLLNDANDGLMIEWRDYKKSNPIANIDSFLKLRFRKHEALVEIIAYCLNPNHFHFILKQLLEKGIERFLHKIGTSHTKYYNDRHKRNGSLFQGVFKSALIDSNEYLLYLSAYVNKNNFIHGYNKNDAWEYSSLPDYLGKRNNGLINKNIILSQFRNTNEYNEFLNNNALYMRNKKELEKYLIEEC
ncbi:transposase [Patescibacteria group bacterium]|nr:transposase [Patescibacteria group bacterium]